MMTKTTNKHLMLFSISPWHTLMDRGISSPPPTEILIKEIGEGPEILHF